MVISSSCKFLCQKPRLLLNLHPIDIIIRMDDTTFLVTWDDTDNVGLVNLTKDELKEFTIRSGSDKGEHISLRC